MNSEALPPEIAAFIADSLLTLDELEALTAIIDAPSRWWDARLIGTEIGVPLSAARGILDRLAGLNLLDIRVTEEVRYRFQPGTAELTDVVSRLASTYRTNRNAVVRAISRGGRRGVLDFTDAFRVRKHGNR